MDSSSPATVCEEDHQNHDTTSSSRLVAGRPSLCVNGLDNQKRGKATPTTPIAFPWEKLAPELREEIFARVNENCSEIKEYFRCGSYTGMPPLVIALRPLPIAHNHALGWFEEANKPFYMSGAGGYTFANMVSSELDALDSLHISLNDYGKHGLAPLTGSITRPMSISEAFVKPFLANSGIKHVRIRLAVDDDWSLDMLRFITEFPFWLRGFRSLRTLRVEIPFAPWAVPERARNNILSALVKRIHQKIGVKGNRSACFVTGVGYVKHYQGPIGDWDKEIWDWVADEGKVMDWSGDLGWKWPLE
ncbi:uncharacterized protein LY89DRAFT_676162 [Mollisia scopiformis]|uniref:Uncharacterized protein n=1 Tax=Mollisia scopiformis TaxID=149040 RepID=A0A132BBY8_MOLSC|nr:uncharacterized protein LY89DRAFT_676162 [Mollisia scopiformis]KUJ09364.1 hypothetical protein LY89DRAFT_676162 [Mollisia scopiformis]